MVVLKLQVFELRLGNDLPLLFFHRGLEEARNQGLGNFTANVFAKMPPDQRSWSVAGTKARNPRTLGELPRHGIYFALHDVYRNFNNQFFFAGYGFHGASKAIYEGEMRTAGLALRTRIRYEKPESHLVGVRASFRPEQFEYNIGPLAVNI